MAFPALLDFDNLGVELTEGYLGSQNLVQFDHNTFEPLPSSCFDFILVDVACEHGHVLGVFAEVVHWILVLKPGHPVLDIDSSLDPDPLLGFAVTNIIVNLLYNHGGCG